MDDFKKYLAIAFIALIIIYFIKNKEDPPIFNLIHPDCVYGLILIHR